MLKNHDKILGGMIMVPFVKFRLYDTDLNTNILEVEQNVIRVGSRLQKWKHFLSHIACSTTYVRISHTDQDMLTITFQIKFSKPTPLEKTKLIGEISTMDLLQKLDLL